MIIPARGEAGALVTVVSESDIPRAPLTVEDIAILAKTAEAQEEEGIDATEEPGVLDRLTGKDEAKPFEGDKPLEKADPVLVEAAQELSAKLPAETQIVYQPDHGFSWTDTQGWQVYLGKVYYRLEVKWALYQKVTSYLADQGIQPVLVSVELLNAPFYRLEQ